MIRRRSPAGGCYIGRRFYRGGCFLPRNGVVETVDDRAIRRKVTELVYGDDVYARAMHAVMKGSKAARNLAVLRRWRTRALALLVDEAEFQGDGRREKRLRNQYQAAIQGHLALGGC